jgi:2-polyprenyl-3-methyl-5-hydroxy-6-metoxy-1,4-benzoquinol methylase
MKLNYRDILYSNYFTNQSSQEEYLEDILKNRKYYNDYFLNRFLPQNKEIKILDIGCGYGSMLASLQGLGYKQFTGVDASKEAINLLQTTDLGEKITESEIIKFLEKSVEQNLTWDVVLAIDILEHFSKNEIVYILSLLKKIINATGKLIIKIPNMQSPFLSGEIAFGDFTHEVFVTPASLKQVLSACGFSDIESYEASPVAHTLISTIRHFLWRIVRLFYTFLYAIETGSYDNSMIWSRSFFAVARNY